MIRQLIPQLLSYYRERRARKRLAELVTQTRASYECERYRRARAAALTGERKSRFLKAIEGGQG